MTFDLQSQIDLANKISLVALKTGIEIGRQEAKEPAAAQEQNPEARGDPASGSACKPAPLAASIPVAVSGTQCPRLDEIVSAVAYVFSVADETAYAWIIEAIAADRKDA